MGREAVLPPVPLVPPEGVHPGPAFGLTPPPTAPRTQQPHRLREANGRAVLHPQETGQALPAQSTQPDTSTVAKHQEKTRVKPTVQAGVAVHAYNPSTREWEVGSSRVQGQQKPHRTPPSLRKALNETKHHATNTGRLVLLICSCPPYPGYREGTSADGTACWSGRAGWTLPRGPCGREERGLDLRAAATVRMALVFFLPGSRPLHVGWH